MKKLFTATLLSTLIFLIGANVVKADYQPQGVDPPRGGSTTSGTGLVSGRGSGR